MKNGTHTNYLALNQNILGKPLVFGSGPQEGSLEDPIINSEGLKIYLNGKHNLSEILDDNFEIQEMFLFGDMVHPNAMLGMPGSKGDLKYELGVSEDFYVIVVKLKLDEGTNGDSDEAVDILSLIKKSEIPETFDYGEHNNYFISKSMLLIHFQHLFEFYDSYEHLIESGFEINEELALNDVILDYFDLKSTLDNMEKILSKD